MVTYLKGKGPQPSQVNNLKTENILALPHPVASPLVPITKDPPAVLLASPTPSTLPRLPYYYEAEQRLMWNPFASRETTWE